MANHICNILHLLGNSPIIHIKIQEPGKIILGGEMNDNYHIITLITGN